MNKAPYGLNKAPRGMDQSSVKPVLSTRSWFNKDRPGPEQSFRPVVREKALRVFRRACDWQIFTKHTERFVPDHGELCSGPKRFLLNHGRTETTVLASFNPCHDCFVQTTGSYVQTTGSFVQTTGSFIQTTEQSLIVRKSGSGCRPTLIFFWGGVSD